MSKVRVCFLGTPEFAVTCLRGMLDDEHYQVVGVVTQPDRPSGRKMQLTPSPVKSLAQARGIRVISPEKVSQPMILEEISKWGAEVAVVVAFGQILSQSFIDSFQFGAVNVHGSILPKWRGAAPIQRSIEAGDTETGVCLQKVVKQLDAGDVIGVRTFPLTSEMNAQDVHDKMATLGADLLHIELMDFIRGNLAGTPQDPAQVTYAKKIDKAEAEISWERPAEKIHNKVRAFVMGPGTWVTFQGKKLKIHKTEFDKNSLSGKPGTVARIDKDGIWVATGQGLLKILELQPESRNRMPASEFLKGQTLKEGEPFGG